MVHLEIDLFGPLPNNNELIAITDMHSRFPYVAEVKTASARYILPVLDDLFSLMGIPRKVKTDNEIKLFLFIPSLFNRNYMCRKFYSSESIL